MSSNTVINLSGKTILVVEDMIPMRELLKSILRNKGCNNVFGAEDGIDALRYLDKHYIDLVISDWIMPKMDGFELLQNIRGRDELKDILFLMVTNDSEKESVVKAIKHNVNGYIVKPFTPAVVFEQLVDTFKAQVRFRPDDAPGNLTIADIDIHNF